jgi:hypothetical protein
MSLEARRSLQTLTVLPVSSKGTLEDSTGSYKGQHEPRTNTQDRG